MIVLNKEQMFAYNRNIRSYTEPEEVVLVTFVNKYIGQVVEIIYMDRTGKITQRHIQIHGMRGDLVRATCMVTGEPRAFRLDRILAWNCSKSKIQHNDRGVLRGG